LVDSFECVKMHGPTNPKIIKVILLVDSFECVKMHGPTNPKIIKVV